MILQDGMMDKIDRSFTDGAEHRYTQTKKYRA